MERRQRGSESQRWKGWERTDRTGKDRKGMAKRIVSVERMVKDGKGWGGAGDYAHDGKDGTGQRISSIERM